MSGRRRLWAIVSGAAAVVLATVILVRDRSALDAISGLAPTALASIAVLHIANGFVEAMRYHSVLPDKQRQTLGRPEWLRIFVVGRIMNMVVPQSGTAYRAAQLKASHGLSVASFLGGVVVATWVGNAVASVFAALIIGLAGHRLAAVGLLGLALAILGGLWWSARLLERNVRPSWMPDRLEAIGRRLGESLLELRAQPARARHLILLTLVAQATALAAAVLVMRALGVPEPIVAGSVVFVALTVSTVVSLSPGGLGIAELAGAVSVMSVSLNAGLGVAAALVIRVSGTVALIVLALASLLGERGQPR